MRGTEKQIAWAKDICEAARWSEAVASFRQEIADRAESLEARGKQAASERQRSHLALIDRVSELFENASEVSAEMIIDNQGVFNFDHISSRTDLASKASRICGIIDLNCY